MKPERVTDNKSRQFVKESEPVKAKKKIKKIEYDYKKLCYLLEEYNKI